MDTGLYRKILWHMVCSNELNDRDVIKSNLSLEMVTIADYGEPIISEFRCIYS